MAKKKSGPNKSAAIREQLDANPAAKPKEIVEILKTQGIETTPAFVSTIKNKHMGSGKTRRVAKKKVDGRKKVGGRKKGTRRAKTVTGASKPAASRSSAGAYDDLISAKQLVDKLGGVDQAKAALAALEKITS